MKSISSAPLTRISLFILLGLLVIMSMGIRTISNPDIWMHLATGRLIAESGIPHADVFSFTKAGDAWVASTWLYDRVIYTLWQATGPGFVTILHVASVLGAFLLLVPIARKWADDKSIGLALLVSASLLAPCFQIRPLLVGLFFSALYISMLDLNRKPWVAWAVLLPSQLLWTQIHGSFLLGPIICALFAVQAFSEAHATDSTDEDQQRLRTGHRLVDQGAISQHEGLQAP